MQNETIQSKNSAKQEVVLILLGIEKQWVRSKKNGWVDKSKVELKKSSPDLKTTESKPWWQFWK